MFSELVTVLELLLETNIGDVGDFVFLFSIDFITVIVLLQLLFSLCINFSSHIFPFYTFTVGLCLDWN